MTSQLNSQIAQILVQTTPKMEAMINQFEKELFSKKKRSRRALVAVIAEGIAHCAEHFEAGMGIQNSNELAKWATTWNECCILLGNYMCSCPTLLIEAGLVEDCLRMTQGRDYFFEPVLSFIDERKFKTLEKLFSAGYVPLMDDHRLGLLCRTKDVSKCPRNLLEPFVLSGLKKIASSENTYRSGDQISALVGRYLGCAEPSADNLAAFRARIWPQLLELLPEIGESGCSSIVQLGIAGYPSNKTLGISRLIMADCLDSPVLLDQLINGAGYHSHYGQSFNPFEASEVEYSKLPPKFFDHDHYFQSILNGRINDPAFYGTFPAVVKSGFDYTKHQGFGQLQDLAALPMLDIVSSKPSTALNAALILKLTPVEDILEVFQGPDGKVAHLMFQNAWKHISGACDLPLIDMGSVATGMAQCPVEQVIRYREQFQAMMENKDFSATELETLDKILLGEFREMDKVKAYLESLDLEKLSTMRTYCSIVIENPHLGAMSLDRFSRQISWKNQAMRDAIFGSDLGL